MKPVHFYKSKKRGSNYNTSLRTGRKYIPPKFKIVCTGEFFVLPVDPETGLLDTSQVDVTSTVWNTTCPECLKIVLERFEEKLDMMKKRLTELTADKSQLSFDEEEMDVPFHHV